MANGNNFVNPFNGQSYFLNAQRNLNVQNFQNLSNSQPKTLEGKMINSVNDITPDHVPMNGSVGFFPLSDYSRIIAKSWNSDGTITTVEYAPVVQQETTTEKVEEVNPNEAFFSEIIKRLDRLEDRMSNKNNYKKNKEDSSNG